VLTPLITGPDIGNYGRVATLAPLTRLASHRSILTSNVPAATRQDPTTPQSK